MTLYRPTGFQELKLIADSGWRAFPPRLPDQPIFYPVLNFEYARQIAEGWNMGYNNLPCGFITQFEVRDEYISQFAVQTVGAREHQELWIPDVQLKEFNANIVGRIAVEGTFFGLTANDDLKSQVRLLLESISAREV